MINKTVLLCILLCLTLTYGLFPAARVGDKGPVVNVLSLQEGALPVVEPPSYGGWPVIQLLDDSPASGWACEDGKVGGNVFVFELLGTTAIERFEFDTAGIDTDGAAAKDVLVEVSVDGPKGAYQTVLKASLADKKDNQPFQAQAVAAARWVRLTVLSNHGSQEWCELFSFRGFGPRPDNGFAVKDVSGTYDSSYAQFHVRQQGSALIGCYEYNEGLLDGSIDGRLMKLVWSEGERKGPALMVFSQDGRSFHGFWWNQENAKEGPSGEWNGQKVSAQVGACPHWSGSVSGELKKQLNQEGRAKVYGILFDLDSARIRPESAAVLEEMASLLRSEAEWSLIIEGHTDSSGSAEHNQSLSLKRAEAVKAWLVKSGIDAGRLSCKGYGQSKPVADNGSELGRAQNRRVELVKEK